MSDITNRIGLPIIISDHNWDGSNSSAPNLAATVTSGALLVSLTDASIQQQSQYMAMLICHLILLQLFCL
jgi:hypothetical protein